MNKEKRLWPERDAESTSESERGWLRHPNADAALGTPRPASSEEGAIGYILLWLMGVPASILFLIFLLRGCN
jgi:hypothetical protein